MLGKAERSWRTLQDIASALLHSMSVLNSMWSCAISTVVYLRNRMFSRVVGASCGVPLTLLTSQAPDASKRGAKRLRQGARKAPSQTWGTSVARHYGRLPT
jgi:hypothetical protein